MTLVAALASITIIEILYKPGLMLLDLISFSYFIRPNVLIHNFAVLSSVVLK